MSDVVGDDVRRAKVAEIREHLMLLASDADTQDAWLHPCGWTRAEPFSHVRPLLPCMPVDELMQTYEDLWSTGRRTVEPVISSDAVRALDALSDRFEQMTHEDFRDEIESLDRSSWDAIRADARDALKLLATPAG